MRKQAADEGDTSQTHHHQPLARSSSPGGGSNLAGKWFKGVFGRSPRADEKDPHYSSDLGPFPLSARGTSDAEDQAAYAQKLASMRQARHIVDEERQRCMLAPTTPAGTRDTPGSAQRFDPDQDREFRPRQVVDSDVEDDAAHSDADVNVALQFQLGRKKSPPGRKPVPAYLPGTSPITDAAALHDEPLTPAQRIIQETRSKQMAREQIEAQRKEAITNQQQLSASGQRKITPIDAQLDGPPTPSKDKANHQAHQQRFPSGAHQITREPARGAPQPETQTQNRTTIAPHSAPQRNPGTLAPGTGPMPADLGLRDALQEMMVRFYRFERYSVPLIRSLETRLLDIERDAMLANNPQARSGTRASISSNNSAEMDRWVNQMTSLMKHEIGQLKAATREIKESRELVATVARQASASSGGVGLSTSVSSFGSLVAITPEASVQTMQKLVEEEELTNESKTNLSSSTLQDVVPRLALPAGAKPALEKDQGKHTHTHSHSSPTKANFGFASESGKEHKDFGRERSVSPNGRPRFTSVLGKPLGPAQPQRLSAVSSVEDTKTGSDGLKRDNPVETRLKALMEAKGDSAKSTHPNEPEREGKRAIEEATADESRSSDIAAALAAIDASSSAAAPSKPTAPNEDQHHVPISKSSSNSSSNSGSASASASIEEPLTPTVEVASAKPTAAQVDLRSKHQASDDSVGATLSRLPYLHRDASQVESVASAPSPIKTNMGSSTTASPTMNSGRISPNKLFSHKLAASGGVSASASGAASSAAVGSASAKLGLVEKKRFTLPAPSSAASTTLGAGTGTTLPARHAGRVSRTPSYTLDDSCLAAAPTSAAFSALAKVKPVGHRATLQERVAFFDAAK